MKNLSRSGRGDGRTWKNDRVIEVGSSHVLARDIIQP